jgi:iron uptake system component EfeO
MIASLPVSLARSVVGSMFAVLFGSLLLIAGCKSGANATNTGANSAFPVAVTLSNDGCAPRPATAPAGAVTITVSNKNGSAVSEAELLQGSHVLGEKENLTPGLSGSFSLQLAAGQYQLSCPGAKQASWPFTVTGSAAATPALSAALTQAVGDYHAYVVGQVEQLVTATDRFATAVRSGDVAQAKSLYAPARSYYETIEPVAESFSDLDLAIDARRDDVVDANGWTGFHRLEKALWQDGSLDGMSAIADKLVADVAKLQSLVAATTFQPEAMANGASGLLDEVAKTKVTGEEDRYSHTDLWDFAANIAGAKQAFSLLQPTLAAQDATLAQTISQRFRDVEQAIGGYASGAGYVDYSTVDAPARKTLTQKVDALAEPLSRVAAIIASAHRGQTDNG